MENSSQSTAHSTTAASRWGETPGSGRSPRVPGWGSRPLRGSPRAVADELVTVHFVTVHFVTVRFVTDHFVTEF
uniref:Uncharacterized protein n=1 Tax=Globodera rostochiensis TaxID=31243 RepID=A0A914HXD1_GLORO